jgi:uncharacterized delta-60 repeat protein
MRVPLWFGLWSIAALLLTAQPGTAQIGSADAFDPNATNGNVYAAAVQADGKVFVAGNFDTIGGYTLPHDFIRPGFFRLNADGTRDLTFAANIQGGPVECMAVQPDGKLLMGGDFSYANGYSMHNMVRLNADGTLPITGTPPLTVPAFVARPDGHVRSIALLPDGKIIILGTFTSMDSGAVSRSHIARLNADGSLDMSFDPPVNSGLTCMALQPDGKLIVSGSLPVIGGVPRTVTRLTTTGAVDPTFADPAADSSVSGIVVQADGKVLVGGSFENIGGANRPGLARLNTDGTLDSSFSAILNSGVSVTALALQADGRIVLGGIFFLVNDTPRNRIARLLPTGAVDMTFNPASGGELFGSALQADGRLVVTGGFQHEFVPYGLIGGQQRNRIARLMNDSVTDLITVSSQSQITWARGGTAPEAFSVRFELSNDGGITWATLGDGTRIAGGWQITGLSLPATGIVRGIATVPVTHIGGSSSSSVASSKTYAFPPAAEVATLAATDLAATSATLNATIDPNGSATTALFQYGLTAAYGSILPITLIPNDGSAPLHISLPASGLTPHVLYHYRVVATNAFGTSYGENFTFHSNATPNTPALSSSSIAENQPVASTVGTLGTVADSDGDSITYSLVSGEGDTDNFSFTIVGNTLRTNEVFNFEWQSIYHIRVRATDGFTNGTAEAALTITILNVIEPPIVAALPATNLRHSSAALKATLNPNSITTNAQFQYGLTTSYGSTADVFFFHTDATAHAVEAYVGGLLPSTTYHYRFIASNDDGSTEGDDQTFTTRATSPGDVELAFNPNVQGGAVQCTAIQSDGKILIGGSFTQVNGVPRNNLARLNSDGSLDLSFDPNPDNVINCVAVQVNGMIIIGGSFSHVGSTSRNNLARITISGSVDASFTPLVNGAVTSLLANVRGGELYVSGMFTTVSGQPRGGFARLDYRGALETTFSDMAPDGQVNCMIMFSEFEGVVVGGNFSQFGGEARHGLARVNDAGLVVGGDDGLVFADAGTSVNALYRVPGAILVGGYFSTFGGAAHENIARITIDDRNLPIGVTPNHPVVDTTFTTSVSGGIQAFACDVSDRTIIGGSFFAVNGTSLSGMARLNYSGALDTSFDPGPRSNYFNSAVTSLTGQMDGKVIATGLFTHLGGEPKSGFARLHNDYSDQSVHINYMPDSAWTASWWRFGTAPEITKDTKFWYDYGNTYFPYQYGADGTASYRPWDGTHSGSLWTQTLNLINTRTPKIRAAGRVGGGSSIVFQTEPVVPSSVNEWRLIHFGTTSTAGVLADAADVDGDGVPNLIEYALGTSPTSAAGRALPAGEMAGAGPSARFEIRFTQPAGITGITYGAEWTATLGGAWTPVTDTGVLPEHVFSMPIVGESRGFMRIVVTRTP